MLAFNEKQQLTVKLSETSIGLDCRAGEACFVSHAHSDHAEFSLKKPLLATPATVELLRARKYLKKDEMELFQHADVKLENAGHVLGSAQLRAENDGASVVYTGDFKLSDSLTCKGAEVLHSDVLVMEATYGMPQHKFPDRDIVYEQIAKFVNETMAAGESVVLGGYTLGKAQELVAVLNEYCGVSPITTPAIQKINDVYVKHGVKLDSFVPESDREFDHSFVAVMPANIVGNELASNLYQAHGQRVRCGLASGWATSGGSGWSNTPTFCLSDHADYDDLLRYASESGASQVYLFNGYGRELSRDLGKMGIEASFIEDVSAEQKKLNAFVR
ncbi:MAG TPA: hypothetical protein VGQ00_02565 [Candidatus Norongarragalinales archaeon]|jgi:Cft2 family RNA processing exonuclease|nr:hypothetical protein [Candidatus Norongarragalinales archaeon]